MTSIECCYVTRSTEFLSELVTDSWKCVQIYPKMLHLIHTQRKFKAVAGSFLVQALQVLGLLKSYTRFLFRNLHLNSLNHSKSLRH